MSREVKRLGSQTPFVTKPAWYAVPLAAFFMAEIVNSFILNQKMSILFPYYQFLDPIALRNDLFRGMMLLHGQPPLLNLAAGSILKLAATIGCRPEAIANVLFGALGLMTAMLLFHLTCRWTRSRLFGTAAVVLYFAEPSYFGGSNSGVGRNNFFYEFALQSVLLLVCWSAALWIERKDIRAGLAFVTATATVVNTRTLFHPLAWGLVVIIAVFLPDLRRQAKKVLILGGCAVFFLAAWPLKNYFLYGILTSSSWDGYNLCRGLAPLPLSLQRIDMNDSFPPAAELLGRFPRIASWPSRSLQVVTSGSKSSGGPNWNSLFMVAARNEAVANGLAARKNVSAYWTHMVLMYKYVTRAMYVQPYSDEAFGKFPDQFTGYLWIYDRIFFSPLSDTAAGRNTRHWNVFGVIILPAFLFGLVCHIYLCRGTRLLMAVIGYTALFPIISGVLSDGIEGNRMRHSTYPLMILVALILISKAYHQAFLRLRRTIPTRFAVIQRASDPVSGGAIESPSVSIPRLRDTRLIDSGRTWLRQLPPFRVWAFLIGITAFVVLSFNRFSDFAWSDHDLDLVSQADNIARPARSYLASRLTHADKIGCVNTNPAWTDACQYLWYSMLPFYSKSTPSGTEPTYRYLIFLGDPRAAEKPEMQAAHVRDYRIQTPRTFDAFLLVRSNP
jgi:hypothetical protein